MFAPGEVLCSYVLSVTFVGLGGFFLYREQQRFQRNRGYQELPTEAFRYHRRQFWRRCFASTLLLVIGLLVFASVSAIDESRRPRQFALFWVVTLSLVLVAIALACLDLIAIRHYATRERRRLHRERLELLQDELEELRTRAGPPKPEGWTPEWN